MNLQILLVFLTVSNQQYNRSLDLKITQVKRFMSHIFLSQLNNWPKELNINCILLSMSEAVVGTAISENVQFFNLELRSSCLLKQRFSNAHQGICNPFGSEGPFNFESRYQPSQVNQTWNTMRHGLIVLYCKATWTESCKSKSANLLSSLLQHDKLGSFLFEFLLMQLPTVPSLIWLFPSQHLLSPISKVIPTHYYIRARVS